LSHEGPEIYIIMHFPLICRGDATAAVLAAGVRLAQLASMLALIDLVPLSTTSP
jgi:hypothetical protein